MSSASRTGMRIAWKAGGGAENIAENRKLEILAAVMRDRILDRIRSAEGASYSPTVISQWKKQLLTHAPELFARGKSNQRPEEDNDVLYAEIGRLKLENDFLKKKL